jgi:hypothetical protein
VTCDLVIACGRIGSEAHSLEPLSVTGIWFQAASSGDSTAKAILSSPGLGARCCALGSDCQAVGMQCLSGEPHEP